MPSRAGSMQYNLYSGWDITVWRPAGGWSPTIRRTIPPLEGARRGPLEVSGGPLPTPEEAMAAPRAHCDAEDLPTNADYFDRRTV